MKLLNTFVKQRLFHQTKFCIKSINMNNQQKRRNNYKYRLYDLLYAKYGVEYIHGKQLIAKTVICMSYNTVNNDFGISATENREIPFTRLKAYAEHFGVEIGTLKQSKRKPKTQTIK